MKKLKIIFLILAGISTFAQDPITAEQAAKMVDKEVIVKAVVAGTRLFEKEGKKTFLINLDKRFPQSPLTVVLFNEAYNALNLNEEIEDKQIIVKGTVTIYNERPQIVLNNIKNIQIKK